MARTKKTDNVSRETSKKDVYVQVVKTNKDGSVTMIKGYNKEVKK